MPEEGDSVVSYLWIAIESERIRARAPGSEKRLTEETTIVMHQALDGLQVRKDEMGWM